MGQNSFVIVADRVLRDGLDCSWTAEPAAIVVAGNTIAEVRWFLGEQRADILEELEARGPVLDLGDVFVTPTFVNAHTHLAMSFFRGFEVEDSTRGNMIEDLFYHVEGKLTYDDVRAFTRMGAYESLLAGVGFVWDHYYFGEAVAEGIADVGLAGVVAPALQDVFGPGVSWLDAQMESTRTIAGSSRLKERGIFAAFGPHATDTVSPALWKRILDGAQQANLPLHMHLAQSIEEWRTAHDGGGGSPFGLLQRAGVMDSTVPSLFVHGIFLSRAELELLARRSGSALAFCPFSQLVFQFPAAVREWEEVGIPWALATDCVASNDSMNVQKEMRYVAGLANQRVTYSYEYTKFLQEGGAAAVNDTALRRAGQQEESQRWSDAGFLLKRVTTAIGDLHPQVKVGRLAPGCLANLAVWDSEHPSFWPGARDLRALTMGDTLGALKNMMVAGRWLGRGENLQSELLGTAEYRDAVREATQRLTALQRRL